MPKPIVYSRPSCIQCSMTKKLMKREGIEYDEVDVEQDPAALELIKGLGYLQVPVVVYGDTSWSGFLPVLIKGINDRDVEV